MTQSPLFQQQRARGPAPVMANGGATDLEVTLCRDYCTLARPPGPPNPATLVRWDVYGRCRRGDAPDIDVMATRRVWRAWVRGLALGGARRR